MLDALFPLTLVAFLAALVAGDLARRSLSDFAVSSRKNDRLRG